MERCLFLKDEKGILSVPVPEEVYNKIRKCMELPEEQVLKMFRTVDDPDYIPLAERQDESYLLSGQQEQMGSIFVKDRDYFRRIDFSKIRWIEASGSYCCLFLEGTPKLMLSFNLRELSGHLPSRLFMRVHRSYIVNISYIDSFIGNMLCIGEQRIPVSKQHKQHVISRLNVVGSVK